MLTTCKNPMGTPPEEECTTNWDFQNDIVTEDVTLCVPSGRALRGKIYFVPLCEEFANYFFGGICQYKSEWAPSYAPLQAVWMN